MNLPEEIDEHSPEDVFWTAVLFESGLGLLAVILGWALGPDPRDLIPRLEWAQLWPIASGLMYGCLAAIPILVFIEIIQRLPWEPVRQLERLGDDTLLKTLRQLRPSELVLISLCAGIGEELLFRGWMLCYFIGDTTLGDPSMLELSIAVVGSSIAFGLMHPITKLYIFLAAIIGVYLSVLMLMTGNLLIPIVAHALYDAVQLIWGDHREQPQTAS
ncbi:MAG: CPBP family intramembrane metalloprotease [Pirellulales bacterium]|nr:CPBP family intramembrane metalloprotease [Pirellulales bacterium]